MIYCRISDDQTGREAGVDRQLADCRALCKKNGWRVVRELRDNDISASKYARKVRPGWRQVMEMLSTGEASTLVAYHSDRLYRQMRELEDLIDLADKGAIRVATIHSDFDLNSEDGRFVARIMCANSVKESDAISRRVRREKEQAAADGRPSGGVRPFGYTDDMKIVPAEAKLIREAVQHVLDGGTLEDIARRWTALGLAGTRGNRDWSGTVIKKVLIAPRIAGLRVHHGEVVGKARWKPIIDRGTHERVVAKLTDAARRIKNPPRQTLFTGKLFCARCGGALVRDTAQWQGMRAPVYRCKSKRTGRQGGCGGVTVRMDTLEEILLTQMFRRLRNITTMPRKRKPTSTTDWAVEVHRLEARLSELAEMFAAEEIGRSEWIKARSGVQERLDAALTALARDEAGTFVTKIRGTNLEQQWESLGFARQRLIIQSVFGKARIGPAVQFGFTPDPGERERRIYDRVQWDSDGLWKV